MLNRVILQGRLTHDPELRTTQSGVPVCSFRVAWSETYKDVETKLFISCTAWRGTGEMVSRYFTKGKEILLDGKLSTRSWEDKEGNKRESIEMTVDKVHFCGPKGEGGSSSPKAAGRAVDVDAEQFTDLDAEQFTDLADDDGELPF